MTLTAVAAPGARSFTVRIPGHPPGGNELHRMHHWAVRKSRDTWKTLTTDIAVHVLLEGDPRGITAPGLPWEKARLKVTWRFRVRRERDLDNLIAGLKPLIDALVAAGMIRDDSTACLEEIGPLRVEFGPIDETVLEVFEVQEGAQTTLADYDYPTEGLGGT